MASEVTPYRKLEIRCVDPEGLPAVGDNAIILLDGQPLHGVLRLEVAMEPNELVRVSMQVYVRHVEVEAGVMQVERVVYSTGPYPQGAEEGDTPFSAAEVELMEYCAGRSHDPEWDDEAASLATSIARKMLAANGAAVAEGA